MGYNPIRSVNGVPVKAPSAFSWKNEDLSNKTAGRTEDGFMHKNRIGQIVGIELSWQNLTLPEISTILNAFDPEYVNVEYVDPKAGGYITKRFYVGNRTAPLYNNELGLWSNVGFNIIEQAAK